MIYNCSSGYVGCCSDNLSGIFHNILEKTFLTIGKALQIKILFHFSCPYRFILICWRPSGWHWGCFWTKLKKKSYFQLRSQKNFPPKSAPKQVECRSISPTGNIPVGVWIFMLKVQKSVKFRVLLNFFVLKKNCLLAKSNLNKPANVFSQR